MTYEELFRKYIPHLSFPRGDNVQGRCIFHDDIHASWSGNIRNGLWHCFHGDTRIITKEGRYAIGDCVGTSPLLLAPGGFQSGMWKEAPIRSFGRLPIWKVFLSRNGVEKEVQTTELHRWFVYKKKCPVLTRDLQVNHRLISIFTQSLQNKKLTPSPFGIAHGITFGDGHRQSRGAMVGLCGAKKELLRFFPLSRFYDQPQTDRFVVTDLPDFFKEKPRLSEHPAYLFGWLAGYFATDGCVAENGNCLLSSAEKENLEFVRDLCSLLGIGTYAIRSQIRVGINGVSTLLHHLTLSSLDLGEAFFLRTQHRQRHHQHPKGYEKWRWQIQAVEPTETKEEVFCAVVSGAHAFALEDNILTSNCFTCDKKGNARIFAQLVGTPTADFVADPQPRECTAEEIAKEDAIIRAHWYREELALAYTYDYTDMSGTRLLYQVGKFVHFPDGIREKWFMHRAPDETRPDKWSYFQVIQRAGGHVLYRQSELGESDTIYYVEGEADVDTLRAEGLTATTHATGAALDITKRRNMMLPLTGKHVISIPDNDAAGRAMAATLGKVLKGIAASFSIVTLPGVPEKEDVSWWLANGHTTAELCALPARLVFPVGNERPWLPAIIPFSEIEKEEVPWLWYPIVPLGFLTLLQGDPGAGKGWFYLALAASLSTGQWPFFFNGAMSLSAESNVLIATNEDRPNSSIKARLDSLGGDQRKIHWFSGKKRQGDDRLSAITMADIPLIERAIQLTGSQLLVIDPMTGYLPENVNPNRAEQVRRMLAPLDALAHRTQCAILAVGHFNKSVLAPALYRGAGSIDFAATARVILQALELTGRTSQSAGHPTAKRFAVGQPKNNLSAKCQVLEFQVDHTGQFAWIGTLDTRIEDLIEPKNDNDIAGPFALQEARAFVIEMLKDGPCAAEKVKKHARVAGVNPVALAAAKRDLRIGMQKDGGAWNWIMTDSGQYRSDH